MTTSSAVSSPPGTALLSRRRRLVRPLLAPLRPLSRGHDQRSKEALRRGVFGVEETPVVGGAGGVVNAHVRLDHRGRTDEVTEPLVGKDHQVRAELRLETPGCRLRQAWHSRRATSRSWRRSRSCPASWLKRYVSSTISLRPPSAPPARTQESLASTWGTFQPGSGAGESEQSLEPVQRQRRRDVHEGPIEAAYGKEHDLSVADGHRTGSMVRVGPLWSEDREEERVGDPPACQRCRSAPLMPDPAMTG